MHSLEIIYSCYVTDSRLISASNYGIEEEKNLRPAQLLTTIHTTSRVRAEKTQINLSIDSNYDIDYVEFWNFIKTKTGQHIVNPRLENYADWKKASADVKADCVLLMANHDHAFLLDDGVLFQEFVDFMSAQPVGSIGAVTHWPEYMSLSRHKITSEKIGELPIFETRTNEVIGTVLVRRETLQSWFLEDFTNGSKFVRPDNPFGPSIEIRNQKMFIPPVEFFRHLDGYGHIGMNSSYISNLRPTIQIKPNREIIEVPWERNLKYGRQSFNPTQLANTEQTNKSSELKALSILLKKSWGRGLYPKNFKSLLHSRTLSSKIYLALSLLIDIKFVFSFAISRITWHRKTIVYKIRMELSRIIAVIK